MLKLFHFRNMYDTVFRECFAFFSFTPLIQRQWITDLLLSVIARPIVPNNHSLMITLAGG